MIQCLCFRHSDRRGIVAGMISMSSSISSSIFGHVVLVLGVDHADRLDLILGNGRDRLARRASEVDGGA